MCDQTRKPMGSVNNNGVIITVLLRLFFYDMVRGGSFGEKRIIGALFCGVKTSRNNDSTYHVSGVEGREQSHEWDAPRRACNGIYRNRSKT